MILLNSIPSAETLGSQGQGQILARWLVLMSSERTLFKEHTYQIRTLSLLQIKRYEQD